MQLLFRPVSGNTGLQGVFSQMYETIRRRTHVSDLFELFGPKIRNRAAACFVASKQHVVKMPASLISPGSFVAIPSETHVTEKRHAWLGMPLSANEFKININFG